MGMPLIVQLKTIIVLIRAVFDHLRDVLWEDIFKSSAYAAGTECCEWVQVGIAVYIPHKYQVKPHSSPWVSAVCAAVIAHRNHLLCLYKQNNSSASKGEVRQASYGYKKVLEAAKKQKVSMLIKQKMLSLYRNLTFMTLCELLLVFSAKVNLLYRR